MKFAIIFLFLGVFLIGQSDALRFRCGILSFFGNDRACRASCYIQGHDGGYCDDDDNCNCSEDDSYLKTIIREKFDEFKDTVENSDLAQTVRDSAPSRCRLGDDFCRTSCQAIGRVTGECNDDYTDCTCSEDKVTAKQYALCVDDAICSTKCQSTGYARGECRGADGWDCMCVTIDEAGREAFADIDVVDMDEF